jgi:uncharacterized protein (TIGR02246 family)
MKLLRWSVCVLACQALTVITACRTSADEPEVNPNPARAAAKKPAAQSAPPRAEKEIRAAAKKFVEQFNRGAASEVASHWTGDGDYVNEYGQRYVGREAIEKEYENFFQQYPHATMAITVDSVRLLGPETAIEDGHSTLEIWPNPPIFGRYTAVHVKRQGEWRMASVRDMSVAAALQEGQMADLAWLVGHWKAEHEGVLLEVVYRPIANRHFLERSYQVSKAGKVVESGTQMMGMNPLSQQINSWIFSSDGGHAVGIWSSSQRGWRIETTGVMPDGSITTSINYLSHPSDDTLVWESTGRQVGDQPLPDEKKVVLKRQQPQSDQAKGK